MTYSKFIKIAALLVITRDVLVWMHGSLESWLIDTCEGVRQWPGLTLFILSVGAWGFISVSRRERRLES